MFVAKELLADLDTAHILTTLVETAQAEGYTVRKVPKDQHKITGVTHDYFRYSARNDKRGVKFSFEAHVSTDTVNKRINGKTIEIESEHRDNRGRYRRRVCRRLSITNSTQHEPYYGRPNGTWRTWLDDAVKDVKNAQGEDVTDPMLSGWTSLATFPPLKFDKPGYSWGPSYSGGPNAMLMHCFYKSCRVKGVATILPDLRVSVDEVCRPGAEPWFFVVGECLAKRSGAQPEIIVSEKGGVLVFYPVRNNRVTNELHPVNTYIDYSQISELDGLLIEKAIAKFLEGMA